MVSSGVFGGIFFTVGVAVALPIALLLLLLSTRRTGLLAAVVGALCFVGFALILEQLSHSVMLPLVRHSPLWYSVYGCLAAGIFEETGRLVGFSFLCKWRAKKEDTVATALGYGIGHGGIEAILLAGLLSINNLRFAFALQNGTLQEGFLRLSRPAMNAAAEQMQIGTFWDFAPGGVERIFALMAQIALSVLLWLVVTGRISKLGYPLAILLHAFLNIGAVLGQIGAVTQIWFIELWIGLSAAIVCLIVWMLYSRARHREAAMQHRKAAQARARKRSMKADASADTAGVAAAAALAQQTWEDLDAPEQLAQGQAGNEAQQIPPEAQLSTAQADAVVQATEDALAQTAEEAEIVEDAETAEEAEIAEEAEAAEAAELAEVATGCEPREEAQQQEASPHVPAQTTAAATQQVEAEASAKDTAPEKPTVVPASAQNKPKAAPETASQAALEVLPAVTPVAQATPLVLPEIPLAPPAAPRRRVVQGTESQNSHKNWRRGKRR